MICDQSEVVNQKVNIMSIIRYTEENNQLELF